MGGRIINNGSLRGSATPQLCARPPSIGHGLTKSCALDGRAFKIACGQIDVGNADTVLLAGMKGAEPTMDVDDVGRAIVLASLPPRKRPLRRP